MSLYRRQAKRGVVWYVDLRWRGYPRIRLSTGTVVKARAQAMERTVKALRDHGRRDLLELLAKQRVELSDVHEAYEKRGDELAQLQAKVESPQLGEVLDAWFAWLRSALGISPRTQRRYAANTIHRYVMSWANLLRQLHQGRETRLSDLTKGFVADFRRQRAKDGAESATVNRDLCALMAFRTWCADERELTVPAGKIRREREPSGRERWLTSDELEAVRQALPATWWPLFATLIYTGMRVGEAQALLRSDVSLAERRLAIHERTHRVKTRASNRDVPIPDELAEVLRRHLATLPRERTQSVFPAPLNDYRAARRVWRKACLRAGLHDGGEEPQPNATIHDLRHTFGVHAAKANVPIARLQRLLGHATPVMTMRYMKHAPQEFFGEDAAKIADSMRAPKSRDSQESPGHQAEDQTKIRIG